VGPVISAAVGNDLDVYARGKEEAPFVAEVKARKNGNGFTTLETWLADYDCLFLRRNHAEPLVVLPWRVWRTCCSDREPAVRCAKRWIPSAGAVGTHT